MSSTDFPLFYNQLLSNNVNEAWECIYQQLCATWGAPINPHSPYEDIAQRERTIHEIDLFLSSAAWDLWKKYPSLGLNTSKRLEEWWKKVGDGKAILILDGFSLRELPALLHGAREHGFHVDISLSSAEVPCDTTTFAHALGYGQRSKLQSSTAASLKFPQAAVQSNNLPWNDCVSLVPASQNIIFWHEWPDDELHRHDGPGSGFQKIVDITTSVFGSEDFWKFVGRLLTGRRLIITSDHGYAVTSNFSTQHEQDSWLQVNFGKQRYSSSLTTA